MPWNFPLLMAAWKLAPALACGNTAILKPAETTPLTALLLAEICQEAELPRRRRLDPARAMATTGAALVRQQRINKIAFTGSTAVGRDIQATLAGTGIRLTLELGGKSANIVFEDAALDQAVEGIVNGIFFNQGHVCCAGSRLLIQESVRDEVIAKLWQRMGRLRVGDPMDKNTDVGAINSAEQLSRIETLVAAGEDEGATRQTIECELPERGYWFAPTLFTDVSPGAPDRGRGDLRSGRFRAQFRTQAEAIEKANNSRYGLAAGIWTDKGSKAFEVAGALRAGVVWQNTYNHFDPTAAFGGYKESGFGREGGPAGLRPYLGSSGDRRAARRSARLTSCGSAARSCARSPGATTSRRRGSTSRERSRKDVREAVAAARKAAGPWAARTAYNRGQILYRAAEALESRAALMGVARDRGRRRRSTCCSTTRAGPTRSRRCSAGSTRSRRLSCRSRCPSRPASSESSRPTRRRCSGWSRSSRRPSPPATQWSRSCPSPLRSPAWISRRCWASRHSGGRREPAVGPARRACRALGAHRDLNAIVDAAGDAELSAELDKLAAETIKRVRHGAAATSYEDAVGDALERIEAVTELKTAWHPVGA